MDDIDLLFRRDNEWVPAEHTGHGRESDLQQILHENPGLIPHQGPGLAAVREFQTGSGPVDVIIVDSDGNVTILECKQSANRESRREIIGQALDYAGRLWEMPLDRFLARWRERNDGRALTDQLDLGEEGLARLEQALAEGRFRLVLALDELNDSMCRIVDYLNRHTQDSLTVMAMEFRYWRDNNTEILLPRIHGREAAIAKENRATESDRWTWERAQSWMSIHRPQDLPRLTQIISAFSRSDAGFGWTSSQAPSFVAEVVTADGSVCYPYRFALGQGESGVMQIRFDWLTYAKDSQRESFLDALARIADLELDPAEIRAQQWRRRPSIPLSRFDNPALADELILASQVLRS